MKKIQLLAIKEIKEAKDNWQFFSAVTGKHKLKFSFIVKLKNPIGLQKCSSNDTSSMVQQLKMQLNRLINFLKIFHWIFPIVKSFLIKKNHGKELSSYNSHEKKLKSYWWRRGNVRKVEEMKPKDAVYWATQGWEKKAQNTKVIVRKVTWSGKTYGR